MTCLRLSSGRSFLVLNMIPPLRCQASDREAMKLNQNSSVFCQRMGQHCCVGESSQSLETSLANCPDVDEGHIDGHGSLSSRSFDTTDRDDMFTRGDELFGDETNVKSSIEAGEKAFGHVQEALEMAASDGHPFRQIVYDV